MIDGCNATAEFLSYDDIWLAKGKKYQYNEKQCIERCREDSLCFAMNHDTNYESFCWLYVKQKDSTAKYTSKICKNNFKTAKLIIFFDALKLLDHSFKLQNVRVKDGVTRRNALKTTNETECMKEYKNDAICSLTDKKIQRR